jgi:iron(III) transport system substrate-binding protein
VNLNRRVLLLAALAATVALPFALRPARPTLAPADDALVIITSNNEAIRHEFGRAFQAWYRARTGRTIAVDWRVVGGTSDIARYLEGAFAAAFEHHWTRTPGRAWSAEIQAAFTQPSLPAGASAAAREARAEFLRSDVGCGIDLFFGGGSYDFVRQARAGRIVPSRVRRTHPEWFVDAVIPRRFTGEEFWDAEGCWVGNVLSNFGILYNRDALARLGLPPPQQWRDLTDPRYAGQIALADPTKSSSIAKVFENIIQQEIHRRLAALRAESRDAVGEKQLEARAVREGWLEGLRVIQGIGANARYFTDSAQKPPIDVAQGDCAAGLCIDFYGRAQAEAVTRRGEGRLGFVAPRGGTVNSVDPIALLRGAPHAEAAELFIEFTLTLDAQKLWNFRPGTPGGPERFALRRMPVRRDFYENEIWKQSRSDPDASPFADPDPLVYRPEWTSHLFRELGLVARALCLDTHAELVAATRAAHAAHGAARERALAKLSDLDAVNYERVGTELRAALDSRNKVDEVRMASALGAAFRRQYREARALAEQ